MVNNFSVGLNYCDTIMRIYTFTALVMQIVLILCTWQALNSLCCLNFIVPENKTTLPVIEEPPEDVVTDLATSITLTCSANGLPTPINEWYKDGELITGATQSFLYFSELLPENRGNYTCKAINSKGIMESAPAKLDIKGTTKIIYLLLPLNFVCDQQV